MSLSILFSVHSSRRPCPCRSLSYARGSCCHPAPLHKCSTSSSTASTGASLHMALELPQKAPSSNQQGPGVPWGQRKTTRTPDRTCSGFPRVRETVVQDLASAARNTPSAPVRDGLVVHRRVAHVNGPAQYLGARHRPRRSAVPLIRLRPTHREQPGTSHALKGAVHLPRARLNGQWSPGRAQGCGKVVVEAPGTIALRSQAGAPPPRGRSTLTPWAPPVAASRGPGGSSCSSQQCPRGMRKGGSSGASDTISDPSMALTRLSTAADGVGAATPSELGGAGGEGTSADAGCCDAPACPRRHAQGTKGPACAAAGASASGCETFSSTGLAPLEGGEREITGATDCANGETAGDAATLGCAQGTASSSSCTSTRSPTKMHLAQSPKSPGEPAQQCRKQ